MGSPARKLAADTVRCPKCGRDVALPRCGHCGHQLSQRDLYSLMMKQSLQMGGNSPTVSTRWQGDADSDLDVIPISLSPLVNHDRYTPPQLIALVHKALGQIDLDPASSKEANKVVKAKSFFTKRTNGLKQRWHGRVFLNPPFDDWPTWIAKLDKEVGARHVKQAVVIGPANISAFRPLLLRNGLLFVPNERPRYYDPHSDKLIDPPFGSLICYVGPEGNQFAKVFGARGLILRSVNCQTAKASVSSTGRSRRTLAA